MDFKDTIFLPKTNFPMKANLAAKELEIENYWTSIDLFNQVLAKNKDGKPFSFHDGPPYANKDIHIGHAFQKSLKDFIIRYHLLKGEYVPFVPGWDTHGLPIENEVAKKLNRKTTDKVVFRDECEKYALSQVEKQSKQFQRLGILGFWDKPYLTLSNDYVAEEIKIFAQMTKKGLIYQGLKPIYYSPSSESALAEAEIEHYEVEDPSIYLKFKIKKSKIVELKGASLLIWTTTPWTIPANLAVSVNPDFDYILIKSNKGKTIILEDELETLTSVLGLKKVEILHKVKGRDLEYTTYTHPLNGKVFPVILGNHVLKGSGTGLVHTAPAHGEDDYLVGKQYKLDIVNVVDEHGLMNSNAGEYLGIPYLDANAKIIEDLTTKKSLVKQVKIHHQYPHDWRTKKRVIFLSTPQWFVDITLIKDDLIKAIKNVNWLQPWGELRISNMMESRTSWCISRQRLWGVPIPIIYENKVPILDEELINHIAEIFRKEGSNVWFTKPASYFIPQSYLDKVNIDNLTKEQDTLDVWFDSGTSYSVIQTGGYPYPCSLYFEGSDQYRGWFNSSLVTAVAVSGKSPYETCISHGFVLDGQGRKMSKSLGNTIDPQDIIKEYGADVLRLWASSIEYKQDVRISKDAMVQVAETYRKIRNTVRYMLGVLNNYDYNTSYLPYEERDIIDKIATIKLYQLNNDIIKCYDDYNFLEINKLIIPYITNFLSAFYLDFTKDIVYIDKLDDKKRLSILAVVYDNLNIILPLLNPIIPHTTSEAYQEIPNKKYPDVLFESIKIVPNIPNLEYIEDFEVFLNLRSQILVSLEEARTNKLIGKSLEASLKLTLTPDIIQIVKKLDLNLERLLIVSEVILTEGKEVKIEVNKLDGKVCVRCWATFHEVDSDGLCPRCSKIIKEMNR